MAVEFQPMVSGGRWLLSQGVAHYVTHPEHVKRMLSEGAEPIADPRVQVERKPEPAPAPAAVANEDAYKQRIAELEALLQAKNVQDTAPAEEKPAATRRGAK